MIIERLFAFIAPYDCLVCGVEGSLLCEWCEPDALPSLPERCYRCHAISKDSRVCRKCRTYGPLNHVWVRTSYEGYAKSLLHVLKFEHGKQAAAVMAKELAEMVPYLEGVVVVPVPTATSRIRQRGYDQAVEIAQRLARHKDMYYEPLLIRMGQTRQVGTGRKDRAAHMESAFRVMGGRTQMPERVLLVDDVVTTGATLAAAARCLKKAGVRTVDAVVFAQRQ